MHRLLKLALVLLSVLSTQSLANQCLNYMNHVAGVCGNYRHDPITVHFRDRNHVVQDVTVHRIRNSSNQIVHADLDFRFHCPNGCGTNTDTAINAKLWDFRNAILNNSFFILRDCDPTFEVCCDEYGCNEIFNEAPSTKTNEHETMQRRPRRPIEEWLPIFDSGLNIWDRRARDSRNEQEFRQEVTDNQQAPWKFAMTQNSGGGYAVCILIGDTCQVLQGQTTIGDSFARVDLTHNYGREVNRELDKWLSDWFFNNRPMRCSQQMNCDTNDRCTISMRCNAEP